MADKAEGLRFFIGCYKTDAAQMTKSIKKSKSKKERAEYVVMIAEAHAHIDSLTLDLNSLPDNP
ncbi:MAG: hypothetical protein NTV00_07875, partial [Methylococcales bacterium]|nr:hypothetical protein [Methylococcales bacterium]